MLKIGQILEEVKSESKSLEKFLSKLTIEGGKAKLWHYSSHRIEDGVIKIGGKQNLHSRGEYMAWGRSRSFFYGTEDGVAYDKGVSSDYLYICHIPVKKIYQIDINPNGYEAVEGKVNWESLYEQASNDGYIAFSYYLGGNENAPIVVCFKNLKIDEAYEHSKGGGWIPLGKEMQDYPVGIAMLDGENWYVMQKDGFMVDIANCYLSEDKDPEGYQRPLYQDSYKAIKFFPEYKGKYKLK